jgi:hypothetical protein
MRQGATSLFFFLPVGLLAIFAPSLRDGLLHRVPFVIPFFFSVLRSAAALNRTTPFVRDWPLFSTLVAFFLVLRRVAAPLLYDILVSAAVSNFSCCTFLLRTFRFVSFIPCFCFSL